MPDNKADRVARKFESLPETFNAVRVFENGEVKKESQYKFIRSPLKKKKKDGPDRFALSPERPKDDNGKASLLDFMGLELSSEFNYRILRGFSVRWTLNTFNKETGLFVPEEFAKCVQTCSARGETIKALKEEKDELSLEIVRIGTDMTIDPKVKAGLFEKIAQRISEINSAIEFKQASPDEDDEDEDDVETPVSSTPSPAGMTMGR